MHLIEADLGTLYNKANSPIYEPFPKTFLTSPFIII